MKKPTQARLKELFQYDPGTGVFILKTYSGGRKHIGDEAGYLRDSGYRYIKVDGTQHFAHRLAWLYIYGYFPENEIDHINRVKDDNRIFNLREVSGTCNRRNRDNRCDNTSGIKGVSWHKQIGSWQGYIAVSGKIKYLGIYKDFDEAVCARLAGEQCLNWSGCDLSSPAYKHVRAITSKAING